MKNVKLLSIVGVLLGGFTLCGVQGCKSSSGGSYSDAEVARMNAVAAGAKDPSKLPPGYEKDREAATAALRATVSTPPPGPPPGAAQPK